MSIHYQDFFPQTEALPAKRGVLFIKGVKRSISFMQDIRRSTEEPSTCRSTGQDATQRELKNMS